MAISRREFIIQTAATAIGLTSGLPALATERKNGIPYRKLGKTGLSVSLLNLGGYHIGVKSLTTNESVKIIRTAIDEGINFLDNAWEYHDGTSEERMGKALSNGYREKVVLMTKHHGREPLRAQKHLEDSLRRLKTDMIDVWQFHELDEMSEVEEIYSSGVLDFAIKAKEQGKIKHIGFTGHYRPNIHLEMINRGFDWETIQMPINILDYHYHSFIQHVLPLAVEKNMGIIGMKSVAGGRILRNNIATAEECLRFSMSMPISTLSSGMNSMEVLNNNLSIARNFKPMGKEDISALLEKSEAYGKEGIYERFKNREPDPEDDW